MNKSPDLQTTPRDRAVTCLVADAPDSALSVYEDGVNVAIVLRRAPNSVLLAVLRFVQGLLTDHVTTDAPTEEP